MAPTDARAIVDAVASAFQSGSTDFATAQRQLATAIRLAPTLADAHYYRGGLDVLRGDGQSALPHLRAAIRLDPQHADAYYELGNACMGGGDARRSASSARLPPGQHRLPPDGTAASPPPVCRSRGARGRRAPTDNGCASDSLARTDSP